MKSGTKSFRERVRDNMKAGFPDSSHTIYEKMKYSK